MSRDREAGLTTLELAIGLGLLSVLVGVVVLSQRSALSLVSQTTTSSLLDENGLRAAEILASDIRWADTSTFLITKENGCDRIDLNVPTGFAGGAPVWSPTITYRAEPSLIDANRNGVLDEVRLVRIQNGETRKVCDYMIPGGFSATTNGESVSMQITLAKRDNVSDELLTADIQRSISLRN